MFSANDVILEITVVLKENVRGAEFVSLYRVANGEELPYALR